MLYTRRLFCRLRRRDGDEGMQAHTPLAQALNERLSVELVVRRLQAGG